MSKPPRKGPHFRLEKLCGDLIVCGVDEAGRGPWAGPVTAAAVILDPKRIPKGLNDSKKLSHARREDLELEIKDRALAWAVGSADIEEIAALNILHATGKAMARAIEGLAIAPDIALVDGNYRFPLLCEVRPITGGDGQSLSIAAASILAKTARDRLMVEMDALYPGYGFAIHKGYGVPVHAEALDRLGPCPIHRRSFGRVRLMVEQMELELKA
jgi:ribonuclease HII